MPPKQVASLKVFFCQCIVELGMACRLRQRVIATAITYFRRVYSSHSLCKADPRLLYVTALYLAAKSEETSVAAKHMIATARKLPSTMLPQHYDIKEVLDAEVALLEALDFVLLVPSPYVDLAELLSAYNADKQLACAAWGTLNDAYILGDVCLMHPPFLIAAACMVVGAAAKGIDIAPWVHALRGLDAEALHGVVMEVAESLRGASEGSHALSPEDVHRQLDLLQVAARAYAPQPATEDTPAS